MKGCVKLGDGGDGTKGIMFKIYLQGYISTQTYVPLLFEKNSIVIFIFNTTHENHLHTLHTYRQRMPIYGGTTGILLVVQTPGEHTTPGKEYVVWCIHYGLHIGGVGAAFDKKVKASSRGHRPPPPHTPHPAECFHWRRMSRGQCSSYCDPSCPTGVCFRSSSQLGAHGYARPAILITAFSSQARQSLRVPRLPKTIHSKHYEMASPNYALFNWFYLHARLKLLNYVCFYDTSFN